MGEQVPEEPSSSWSPQTPKDHEDLLEVHRHEQFEENPFAEAPPT